MQREHGHPFGPIRHILTARLYGTFSPPVIDLGTFPPMPLLACHPCSHAEQLPNRADDEGCFWPGGAAVCPVPEPPGADDGRPWQVYGQGCGNGCSGAGELDVIVPVLGWGWGAHHLKTTHPRRPTCDAVHPQRCSPVHPALFTSSAVHLYSQRCSPVRLPAAVHPPAALFIHLHLLADHLRGRTGG